MDQHGFVLRLGTAAIVCALLLRLSDGLWIPLGNLIRSVPFASVVFYMETGRILRPLPETEPTQIPTEATLPAALPVFSAEEGDAVAIHYACSYEPDIGALLEEPLTWDLRGDDPTVLILHTHATESYTPSPGEDYAESSAYRTLDPEYNMLSIGAEVAQILENHGISVIHDTTLHDHPAYSSAYVASRETITRYLAQYPSIQLVLDLHRDAAETADGRQMTTSATVDGQSSAQLMLVMGSDAGGLDYPNWEQNLSLALKLQTQLERQSAGICRSIHFCASRYNQDLLPGVLLVEVGAAGNTHGEALIAARALAEGILSLAQGSG